MMFGQLSNRESLLDNALVTRALADKDYHLRVANLPPKVPRLPTTTGIITYSRCSHTMWLPDARKCRTTDVFKLGGDVYAFDSTTVELCLMTFKLAI